MRIAHIFSSDFIAGSVMYALQLAQKQIEQGHEVILITDKIVSDTIESYELSIADRHYPNRISNIRYINKLITERDIHIIHAHSRAASWVSTFAVRNTNTALVSTIHGIQGKKSIINKNVYGEKIIAICKNVQIQLEEELKFDKKKIELIPNGIQFDVTPHPLDIQNTSDKVISLIGRLNGPKGKIAESFIKNVFPVLLKKHTDLTINILGGDWNLLSQEGKIVFDVLRKEYSSRINFIGFTKDVKSYMLQSSFVIGAGRVALEATEMNIPVYAVGESNSHRFLTKENIEDAMSSNFGDILPVKSEFNLNVEEALMDFEKFLNGNLKTDSDLKSYIHQYDITNVVSKVYDVYRVALMQKIHPNHIPVLMYHKVPDEEINSTHKIFVAKKDFEKHLKFFKNRGLTSITLKEYNDFSEGKINAKNFPDKPFILTFDDGYADNYSNMLPLAEKYGFKGVIYLLGDFDLSHNNWDKNENPDDNKLMTLTQKKLFVEKGWEIGAHTLTHPSLIKIPSAEARAEIIKSKEQIEEKLNVKISSFAYPYGDYDEYVKSIVKAAGFDNAVATDSGGLLLDDDRYAIFRVNMFPDESLFSLYKKTSGWYRSYYWKKRGK